jgi:hypothetical protein
MLRMRAEVSDANQHRAKHRTRHLLLLDQVGSYGPIWLEMSDGEANEATIIDWIAQWQFDCPLRVVAFSTDEHWSRDVTREIATQLLYLNHNGFALGAVARDFVVRVTGKSATAIA